MRRRLFQFASLMSFLLFLTVVTIDVRSHYVSNHWDWRTSRPHNNDVTTSRWVGIVSGGGIQFTRHISTSREGNPFTHPPEADAFRFSERYPEGYPAMYWLVPRGTGLTFKEGGRGMLGNSAWRWWTLDWTDGVEHEHNFNLQIVVPLTFPLVLFAILPIARIVSHFVRESASYRDKLGLCQRCGYSLQANTSGVCPECGTRVQIA